MINLIDLKFFCNDQFNLKFCFFHLIIDLLKLIELYLSIHFSLKFFNILKVSLIINFLKL